jgi:sugar lactone lactonase YvrE
MIRPLRRHASLVIIPLFLAACAHDAKDAWRGTIETRGDGVVVVRNPEQGAWRPHEAWTLEEELRIGFAGGSGPSLLRDVAALEVDALGRVWVLERGARELRVFDVYGKHVRTLGGPGTEPGRFAEPVGLAWAPDGTLWVADPGNARFTAFDTAGHFAGDHPRRVDGTLLPWRGAFGRDGLLYEVAAVPRADGGRRAAVLRFDAAMDPLDTLLLPPASARRDSAAGPAAALDPDGRAWVGAGDGYRLSRLRFGRDTARRVSRIVEREAPPVPGGTFAVRDVMPDSGGAFWVRPALPASETGAAFDVFDAEGRYQGRVRLPAPLDAAPSPLIRGGALYGVASDSTGVSYVVRARIRRGTP